MAKTNPFDKRRQKDPQGLIDDLVAQTTRQVREIHRLNQLVESLQKKEAEPDRQKTSEAMKPMQYFNGRCPFHVHGHSHAYICAHSKAEAVRLGKQAFGEHGFSQNELREYWADCWGTRAETILGEQTEPGVFLELHGKFFRYIGG